MPSLFDEIDALSQAAIEEQTGEPVAFIGMISGDYTRAPDPARPEQTGLATVSISPRTGRVADGIQGRSSSGSQRAFPSAELWMSAAAFAGLDWEPVKDDKVVVSPGEAGAAEYTVSGVYPMDHGDVQIILSRGGREA